MIYRHANNVRAVQYTYTTLQAVMKFIPIHYEPQEVFLNKEGDMTDDVEADVLAIDVANDLFPEECLIRPTDWVVLDGTDLRVYSDSDFRIKFVAV